MNKRCVKKQKMRLRQQETFKKKEPHTPGQ